MNWHKSSISITTNGQGLYPITNRVEEILKEWHVNEGMCYLYIQHTSASLTINESYDPSARKDMEEFLNRLAPENQGWYRHTSEGSDDAPSHLKAMLTAVDLSIPVDHGKLNMGTWQGIYLCEHRKSRENRSILVRCLSV